MATMKHSFGSDNHSGVHPVIMEAIVKENNGFRTSYGADDYTCSVLKRVEDLLGGDCKALFVLNGTGANVIALAPFLKSFNSILAPATAHINVDECGAPDKFSSSKIIPLQHIDGKVTPEIVKGTFTDFGDQHRSRPKILSISQPAELGTLYTPEEIKALAELMHDNGGYLHIDGSRISNAAAALNLSVKAITADCDIDSLSFGGTKNGLLIGEAVVIFCRGGKNREMAESLCYIRKQATQLYSKNRFIAAQFEAYLFDNLYLKMAEHSNCMAKYLAGQLGQFSCIKISKKVESNAVFATMPKELSDKLHETYYFYIWDESVNEARLMCSFNTQKEDIDDFISSIGKIIAAGK